MTTATDADAAVPNLSSMKHLNSKDAKEFIAANSWLVESMIVDLKATPPCVDQDAANALDSLGQCATAADLQHWEFMLVTLLFGCQMNASKLHRLWQLNNGNRERINKLLHHVVYSCWPYRQHFQSHSSLRSFYENAVLPAVTVEWTHSKLCNYQMFAMFVDQLSGYVYMHANDNKAAATAVAEDSVPMNSPQACNALGHALAAVAARHEATLRLCAKFVRDQPEFSVLRDTDLRSWPPSDIDRLRLKASEMLFAVREPRMFLMFAEPSRVRVPIDRLTGRMRIDIQPDFLPPPPPPAAAASTDDNNSSNA